MFLTSSHYDHARTGTFSAGETVVARTGFEMRLAGNRYTLSPSIARSGAGADIVDIREDVAVLLVHSARITGGLVDLQQVFEVQRV